MSMVFNNKQALVEETDLTNLPLIKRNTAHLEKQWLAVYTQPRSEKKVHKLLLENGFESYCPLNTTMRKWSDRIKKVEEPLFKSYVFVHITQSERAEVRHIPGLVNFVYWLGKPAVIRDEEIEAIKLFLGEHQNVEVVRIDGAIEPGDKLRITRGVMMHKEATALKVQNKTVEVLIESMGFKLVARLGQHMLERMG